MNSKAIFAALLAVSLISGGSAFGKGRENRGEQKNPPGQDARRPSHPQNHGQSGWNERGRRGPPHYQEPAYRDDRVYERGAGPDHAFHRGARLPAHYRSYHYVVEDWRDHHLTAPPRGYHWVQTGADYVLVAIATGVILQLLLNN